MDEWVTQREAAGILGVHVSAVPKMVRRGDLTPRASRPSLSRNQVTELATARKAEAENRLRLRTTPQSGPQPPDDVHDWLAGETPPAPKQVIDFLTLQSLIFPIAAGVVTGAWKVLQALAGDGSNWADERWVPLAISLLIIVASVATQWSTLGNRGARIGATLVGIVNSLLLTGGALGIIEVTTT